MLIKSYLYELLTAMSLPITPEVLFPPFFVGKEVSGIHDCTFQTIMNCDININFYFYANSSSVAAPCPTTSSITNPPRS